jgi:hypothetical protein
VQAGRQWSLLAADQVQPTAALREQHPDAVRAVIERWIVVLAPLILMPMPRSYSTSRPE